MIGSCPDRMPAVIVTDIDSGESRELTATARLAPGSQVPKPEVIEILARDGGRVYATLHRPRPDTGPAPMPVIVRAHPGPTSCIGATWIGDGVPGTVDLLRRSLRPGGMMLIGEPYWRREAAGQATIEACEASAKDDFRPLPELIEQFGGLGCDVVEMVLANQDGWDRYVAAQWLNIRRWLDDNPDDELADGMRTELTTAPARHTRYQREYLGWGVFALMNR